MIVGATADGTTDATGVVCFHVLPGSYRIWASGTGCALPAVRLNPLDRPLPDAQLIRIFWYSADTTDSADKSRP